MPGLQDAHQARYNRPPRRTDYATSSEIDERPDNYPCDRCGSTRHRIVERRRVSGPTPPASMGPEVPHVNIYCADCGDLIDEDVA